MLFGRLLDLASLYIADVTVLRWGVLMESWNGTYLNDAMPTPETVPLLSNVSGFVGLWGTLGL